VVSEVAGMLISGLGKDSDMTSTDRQRRTREGGGAAGRLQVATLQARLQGCKEDAVAPAAKRGGYG